MIKYLGTINNIFTINIAVNPLKTKGFRVMLLSFLVVLPLIGNPYTVALASVSDERVIKQDPVLFYSSDGKKLAESSIIAGNNILLSTNFTNSGSESQSLAVVLEIRDHDGVTVFLKLHGGTLEPTAQKYITQSVIIERSGNYVARTFTISNTNRPEILSPIIESPFQVANSSSFDQFGVKKIYPTKSGGREWHMNMDKPFEDPSFMPSGNPFKPEDPAYLTRNEDGSWRTTSEKSRMLVGGTPQFRDVEMTGYVKLVSAEDPVSDSFTWYARGGLHWEGTPCDGTALKGSIRYDGSSVSFAKELWHGGGDVGYTDKGGLASDVTSPLFGRWVGIKFMAYNVANDTGTRMELWLDESNNNNWRKISEYVDDGDWAIHKPAPGCLNPLTGALMKDDDILLWGGEFATFRSDRNTFDFKHLSVREIQAVKSDGTPVVTPGQSIPLAPLTHMSDTTTSMGLSTYSERQAHVEFVSSASQLAGKKIDQITIRLKASGTPTGIAEIGVFNSDLTVKKLFGTKDASTLTTSYMDYTFALAGGEKYTIQAGDRIGIKFAGGDRSNNIGIMTDSDPADPFDGSATYRQSFTTSWQSFGKEDLYMILKQSQGFPQTTDRFGIKELYGTAPAGREWFSNWDNGRPRLVLSGEFDPYDGELQARGDGDLAIDGHGSATMSGDTPRMYVYDPSLLKLWKNVEITVYAKRVSETKSISWQGIVAGARSGSHDDVRYPDVCRDVMGLPNSAYNGRLTYDGRADYGKEVLYHIGDAVSGDGSAKSPKTTAPFSNLTTPVDPSSGLNSLPRNVWIGYKFVVKNVSENSSVVKLETWMDLTDGKNGGTWTKVNEFTDSGGWSATQFYQDDAKSDWPCPNVPLDHVIADAMPFVFIRADSVKEIDYKHFSIREINAGE
jgi:hypothetical protein